MKKVNKYFRVKGKSCVAYDFESITDAKKFFDDRDNAIGCKTISDNVHRVFINAMPIGDEMVLCKSYMQFVIDLIDDAESSGKSVDLGHWCGNDKKLDFFIRTANELIDKVKSLKEEKINENEID